MLFNKYSVGTKYLGITDISPIFIICCKSFGILEAFIAFLLEEYTIFRSLMNVSSSSEIIYW